MAALEAEGIDMVFNSAANVKHFSKGTDIMDVNYGGVKTLVDFCIRTGASLMHVSTESIITKTKCRRLINQNASS